LLLGGFCSLLIASSARCGILQAEVFNMFVENAVEKGRSNFVSDSVRDASALCTEAGAATFVLQLSRGAPSRNIS
jgi:hypothetical protein